MEEKNVQNNPELSEEQMEQTTGGINYITSKKVRYRCPTCGELIQTSQILLYPLFCNSCGTEMTMLCEVERA